MKLKEESVRYLTEAELAAFKEEEHAERVALTRRVERGEITAAAANREASMFIPEIFDPADANTANLTEVVDNLLKLKARNSHGRRKQKAVRS